MDQIGVLLLAGLTNGSVYGLVGLSISLIYGTNRVINFAQGEFVMLGAMSAILFLVTYSLPLLIAVPAIIVVGSRRSALGWASTARCSSGARRRSPS
jgi:branched-chain amino acid transport system permease protein